MFDTILIANRGEIACRVARTARAMGIRTVAVYSEADASARHVELADRARLIGPPPAAESYLKIDTIIGAAKAEGAQAIHPGYGFLAENAAFAEACGKAGIVFIGPPVKAIEAMGSKSAAKDIMAEAGIPLVPGYHGEDQDPEILRQAAEKIGYPVLLKASAGGGGKGMRLVEEAASFDDALASARREAKAGFGDERMLVEKFIERPRHIEIQVFADSHGNAIHLFERDCSIQRRHQKVIEEAPAPQFPEALRARLCESAVQAAQAVGYAGAGTVEFLLQGGALDELSPFYLLEMNTRLQVEHPVTEAVTGLDLVEWQLRVAAGERLPMNQSQIACNGAAIEARIYAEDPANDFQPTAAPIYALRWPQGEGVRVDTGVREGDAVSPHYDTLITKLIAHGPDRKTALKRLSNALLDTMVAGPKTNLALLHGLASAKAISEGVYDTSFIERNLSTLIGGGVDRDTVALGAEAFFVSEHTKAESRRMRLSQEQKSPWNSADGFVLGSRRREVRTLLVDGESLEFTLAWDGTKPTIVAVGAEATPRRTLDKAVQIVEAGAALIVIDHFAQCEIRAPEAGETQLDVDAAGGIVTSPLHGHLAKLYVGEGDKVEKGDPIAVLEAMKMEHVLRAPCGGLVETVATAQGEQIAQGAIVAQIAEDGGEGA